MVPANWKLRDFIYICLIAILFLTTSCQPVSVDVLVTPSEFPPTLSPTQEFDIPPPIVPNRIERLAQLTIGNINQFARSPDGSQLAVSAASGLYLYREASFEPLWEDTQAGSVTQVIWSPDGDLLAGVKGLNILRVWDAATGDLINSLETQIEYVYQVNWLPRGDRLIWQGSDQNLYIWNLDEELPHVKSTAGVIDEGMAERGPASYSPDASLVAISGWNFLTDGDATIGRIRPLIMMDTETGSTLYTLEDVGLYSLIKFSPDGSLLITGASVRDPSTGKILRILEGYPESALDLAFSPDGSMLSMVVYDVTPRHKVYIWDLTTGGLLNRLNVVAGHQDSSSITGMTWSSDGSRIVTRGLDKTVVIWDVKTGEVLRKITGIHADVLQAEFRGDGNEIYTLTEDAHLTAWDIRTGNPLREILSAANISKLAWTTDSKLLAALSVVDGGLVNQVYIWDAVEKNLQSVKEGTAFPRDLPLSSDRSSDQRMVSPDGKMMASVESYSGQLVVTDVSTDETLFSAPVYPYARISIAWSPVQPILSVTDGTARILIWNAETGESSELSEKDETFWQVSWSTNGSLLAASTPGKVLIWDTSTWRLFQALEGYNGVSQLAFSPDGEMLATGSWDGMVSLWEIIP